MKKLATTFLVSAIFLLSINTIYGQSLESQLAIFFGEVMGTSKHQELKALGKGLSAVGEYRSDIENANARNNHTYNINKNYQNTYKGSDGMYYPNTGYKWENPDDPIDYSVVQIPYQGNLMPYNLNLLTEKYNTRKVASDFTSELGCLFTYKFVNDLNQDKAFSIDEFFGIQRAFNCGEQINLAILYHVLLQQKDANIMFDISVINKSNGFEIASMDVNKTIKSTESYFDFKSLVETFPLGNKIPPGNYIIAVNMTHFGHPYGEGSYKKSSLREEFEILPMTKKLSENKLRDLPDKRNCPPDYCEIIEDVDLRKQPNIEAGKLLSLHAGSCVKLVESVNEGRYFKVNYKGLEGYVFHEALKLD